MKKILSMVVIFCMVFILGACGSKEAGSEANGNTEDEKAKIKIEELNYQVNVEVDNGERYVMMKLTNNSKYVITNFELTYKAKKDVTNEQKNKFYDEIQKNFKFNEEDVNELKQKEISMHAETNRLIDAGQTVDKINCYYFGGSYYLKDINHLKLCEPDIATIKYIDDGKIHTMYYDYANDSYSYDDEIIPSNQWTKRAIGQKIPKLDSKCIIADTDEDDEFKFEAYGFTIDEFNEYVDKCKKLGYIVDELSFDNSYSADNTDGYNVDLDFEEKDCAIRVTIQSPE